MIGQGDLVQVDVVAATETVTAAPNRHLRKATRDFVHQGDENETQFDPEVYGHDTIDD
jgi:hypothetical protein